MRVGNPTLNSLLSQLDRTDHLTFIQLSVREKVSASRCLGHGICCREMLHFDLGASKFIIGAASQVSPSFYPFTQLCQDGPPSLLSEPPVYPSGNKQESLPLPRLLDTPSRMAHRAPLHMKHTVFLTHAPAHCVHLCCEALGAGTRSSMSTIPFPICT